MLEGRDETNPEGERERVKVEGGGGKAEGRSSRRDAVRTQACIGE